MKKCSFFCLLLACSQVVTAQNVTTYTADSLKSGNAKDVLSSFLQLAFNNLTGTNKEFRFTTNPYDFYQKVDADISIDRRYKHWTPYRRFNLSFGLKLDSSLKYNGLTSGFKYAIIDQTDPTTSKRYALKIDAMPLRLEVVTLQEELVKKAKEHYPKYKKEANDKKAFSAYIQAMNEYNQGKTIYEKITNAQLKTDIATIVASKNLVNLQAINADNKLSIKSKFTDALEDYRSQLKKAALWTIGVSDTTYKDKFQFSNVSIVSEFTKGVINTSPGKNDFELNANALYTYSKDTQQTTHNLQRQVFDGSLKLNWVVREKRTDQSYFEAALGIGYHYVAQGLYKDEEAGQFTLNSTLRVRIFSDVWLPVEVKYDPATGNLFGLLNVKVNFSGINALMNKTGKSSN